MQSQKLWKLETEIVCAPGCIVSSLTSHTRRSRGHWFDLLLPPPRLSPGSAIFPYVYRNTQRRGHACTARRDTCGVHVAQPLLKPARGEAVAPAACVLHAECRQWPLLPYKARRPRHLRRVTQLRCSCRARRPANRRASGGRQSAGPEALADRVSARGLREAAGPRRAFAEAG